MANILDYLDWRGDLTLAQDPFNEVDNLILAELSFVDFGGIVPGPGEGRAVPLWKAAEAYFAKTEGRPIDMGVLVPNQIPELLRRTAASPRFRDMKLNGFVDIFDQYVDTDLSVTEMLYFASQAIHIDPSSDVETCTLQGNGEAHYRGYSYCYALDPTTTLEAVNRLINPYTRDLTLEDMNLLQGS